MEMADRPGIGRIQSFSPLHSHCAACKKRKSVCETGWQEELPNKKSTPVLLVLLQHVLEFTGQRFFFLRLGTTEAKKSQIASAPKSDRAARENSDLVEAGRRAKARLFLKTHTRSPNPSCATQNQLGPHASYSIELKQRQRSSPLHHIPLRIRHSPLISYIPKWLPSDRSTATSATPRSTE